MLLEAPDKNAQQQLARVLKYALCQLKMEEKSVALALDMETVTVDGEEKQISKAASIRFLTLMTE